MSYLYISCEISTGTHPNSTKIDSKDEELLDYLSAEERPEYVSKKKHQEAPFCPGKVLTMLEKKGYRLVSSCCNSDTMHWTVRKDD